MNGSHCHYGFCVFVLSNLVCLSLKCTKGYKKQKQTGFLKGENKLIETVLHVAL